MEDNPNPDQETLAMLLPYDTPFAKEYSKKEKVSLAAAQYFDRNLGVQYAIKYAVNPNSQQNYLDFGFRGDCTNFASQILVAGGIRMHDMYPNEQQGWWHRKVPNSYTYLGYAHKTSVSWINADRFVRFMGTSGNEYNNFVTFASKLKSGDHIALDTDRDGGII